MQQPAVVEELVVPSPSPLLLHALKDHEEPSAMAAELGADETRTPDCIDDASDGDVLFDAALHRRAKASHSQEDIGKADSISTAAFLNDDVADGATADNSSAITTVITSATERDHLDDVGEQDVAVVEPSVMNFDAFVSGDWSLVSPDAPQHQDLEADAPCSESGSDTLGTPDNSDDDDNSDRGFVDAFDSDMEDAEPDTAAASKLRSAPTTARPRSSVSLGAIASIRSAAVAASTAKLVRVKQKTQQVAQSKKQALTTFQKNGGLVGWLHGGDASDNDSVGPDPYDDASDGDASDDEDNDESCNDDSATRPSIGSAQVSGCKQKDTLRAASLPLESEAPASDAQQHHRSFPAAHDFKSDAQVSAVRQSLAPTPASAFLRKSLGSRQRASSLLENLYGKVKKSASPAATPPTTPTLTPRSIRSNSNSSEASVSGRVALQPSPRKLGATTERYSFGFEDFASSSSSNDGRSSHLQPRTASVGPSLLSRTTLSTADDVATSAQQQRAIESSRRSLSLSACLADPKLAAEFVNTVMPHDAALLTLLYSIEEYEALVTSDSVSPLAVQVAYATTVIDKFLVAPSSSVTTDGSALPTSKLPIDAAAQLKQTIAQLQCVNAQALPMTLFRDVYTAVYDALRDGFDAFKCTREYARLLHEPYSVASTDRSSSGLTVDAVLANEWCATVFWTHLYRSTHHQRLSFVMHKTFTVDVLYAGVTDSVDSEPDMVDTAAYAQLVAQLQLVARKFLQPAAPVAIPITTESVSQLCDDLCNAIRDLVSPVASTSSTNGNSGSASEVSSAIPTLTDVAHVMHMFDALANSVRDELKREHVEQFATFVASALYRDFVTPLLLPGSASVAADRVVSDARSSQCDVVQLLRASRIPFHQAPLDDSPLHAPDLSTLFVKRQQLAATDADGFSLPSDAIHRVFAFAQHASVGATGRLQPFEYVDVTSACTSTNSDNVTDMDHGQDLQLYQTVEHFLVPEAASRTFDLSDADAQQRVCYNFVAGDGAHAVYGAVWRFPLAAPDGFTTVQGVCVVSKYPLFDALRQFLQQFALSWRATSDGSSSANVKDELIPSRSASDNDTGTDSDGCCQLIDRLRVPLQDARTAFEQFVVAQHLTSTPTFPLLDVPLNDLFDCLSLNHVLQLVALVLLEKKIVLVASRFSVLLAVGEAMRALVAPLVWRHVFVPVLPLALRGYLHCPTPFIFGLHTSYAHQSDVPRPSDDLAVVDLDRDTITGGGNVGLPPARAAAIRDRLVQLIRPRLAMRDNLEYPLRANECRSLNQPFPTRAVRTVLYDEVRELLDGLEAFAFRFEFNGQCVAVADASNRSRAWPADAAAFNAALLQTQAFSAYVSAARQRLE